jgi:hypothetical protein
MKTNKLAGLVVEWSLWGLAAAGAVVTALCSL